MLRENHSLKNNYILYSKLVKEMQLPTYYGMLKNAVCLQQFYFFTLLNLKKKCLKTSLIFVVCLFQGKMLNIISVQLNLLQICLSELVNRQSAN
ncbi:hypothetical protein GDO86_017388 [Hymenochirus boettgeri]|uniref:Uncharacterized protein n=1 Tax=Hymenochirus boettgeri TaxID=247094 RepID=A0A8T2IMS0_9PIPI|nr:hypothetical protein GDO86_017388 [Hymenochirus boettgeri]